MTSNLPAALALALEPAPTVGTDRPRDGAATTPSGTMRAVTHSRFGGPEVLEVGAVPIPRPAAGQVLVRVRAASANPWDWHFMRGLPYIARLSGAGLRSPKHPVLGGDVAGEVAAVGADVSSFAVGDAVYGFIEFGGFAEYAVVAETALAPMPRTLTFELAAAVPLAATTALQGLRDAGRMKAGERVLVVGASGGVGTFAIQLAKAFGAHVTAVTSGRNAALVRAIGADEVVDYTREDVTRGERRFDVVLQLAGTAGASELRRILAPGGRLVMSSGDSRGRVLGPFTRVIRGLLLNVVVRETIAPLTARWNARDLAVVAGLVEAGRIAPVIDSTYALEHAADAIRYLETGRARGKVIISVSRPEPAR
jgi:NADPH:quinone reductase-like Zn-dependent oxidoreductase